MYIFVFYLKYAIEGLKAEKAWISNFQQHINSSQSAAIYSYKYIKNVKILGKLYQNKNKLTQI